MWPDPVTWLVATLAVFIISFMKGAFGGGFAMVGGLLVSQALTLFTTPVIYIYLDRVSNYLSDLTVGTRDGEEKPRTRSAAAE